jgi:AcrR family transcriptional regulator
VTSQEIGRAHRTPGLRERNKAKRRAAIIDASLALLREQAIADITIERIAERAEVSPATVYNLVGGREQLLMACVDRVVDRLVDRLVAVAADADPIEAALMIVDESAAAFIADRDAYRQIIGAASAVTRAGSMPAVDPAQLQIAAMREAQARGILRGDVDAAAIGRQIYLSYNGALFAWAGRGLSDDGFRLAVRHGLWTALAAFAAPSYRKRFLDELRAVGPDLTDAGWGTP